MGEGSSGCTENMENVAAQYDLRTLRLFGKKCRHRGDMKVYKRRSIRLDYPWRG